MIEAMKNYTVSEAAREIGVHRSTVMRDCKAGALPFHYAQKVGTQKPRRYIAGRDLERYRLRIY